MLGPESQLKLTRNLG